MCALTQQHASDTTPFPADDDLHTCPRLALVTREIQLSRFETYLSRGEESVIVQIEGTHVTVTRSVPKPMSQGVVGAMRDRLGHGWPVLEPRLSSCLSIWIPMGNSILSKPDRSSLLKCLKTA